MLKKWLSIVLATLVALAGLGLLVGGVQLALLGGSPYYLLAGAALVATGYGLFRGSAWTATLFGLLLAATLLWALWEVGFDAWALVPRLVAPAVLGVILIIAMWRRTAVAPRDRWWLGAPVAAIALTLLGAGLLAPDPSSGIAGAKPIALADPTGGEWREWGHTLTGERFSALSQINTANVADLKLAWRFDADVEHFGFHSFEATPLAVNGNLYFCADRNTIIAVDQDSGKQVWRYDPKAHLTKQFAATCRGVAYYEAPAGTAECPKRILFGVADGRMMAVDAITGTLCRSFGKDGAASLIEGLGDVPEGIVFPSSAPTIVNGAAILSGWVSDGVSVDEPSGVIRAIDALTGKQRWAWDSGRADPAKPLAPGETYTRSAPNAWGMFSGDEQLKLAFITTGNSTPDYFGAHRTPEAEKYSVAIVALDTDTGKPRWSFQIVHHDLWDYDAASQPVLVDLPIDGTQVPAVIVPNKRGEFFVLDRRDGKPLYPVTERPVPQGAAAGDWVSPTQPYSAFPNVTGAPLTEQKMWGATPFDQLWCRVKFREARYDGEFTPPGLRPAIFYPGSAGGVNWGSVTVDKARGIMVTNSLYMPDIGRLIPRQEAEKLKNYSKTGGHADAFAFEQEGTPYAMQRTIFQNPIGVPCMQPPYGKLTAISLKTGKVVWSKRLGTSYWAGPFNVGSRLPFTMGVPTIGGALTTAGGVVFIGASQDRSFRAIDIGNGRELWRFSLPSVAGATPMTYTSAKTGRQYVVIASSDHPGLGGPPADALLAFALPEPAN